MSHPKNSTTPTAVQPQSLTEAMPIHLLDADSPKSGLLQVCGGKPTSEALFLASTLMGSALEIMNRLTDGGMGTNETFGVRFLIESSAALVDASAQGIEFGDIQGGTQ
ncbi:hypothetical protein HBO13_29285 [Pseudomonas lactis]|uniref:DUF3077 domain-containing protein n=1 Tax=Pseudomonas lactis TaxID=1615674 RepID=A0A7Y1M7P0_9PSED|nr:hypothetical protein [Pseudomonas lactis]NNA76730.1 hypothetical protein [Pseudomonas lactis]